MDKDAIVAKSNMSVNTDAERSTKAADVKSSSSPSPQRSHSSSSTSRATHRQSFTESYRNLPPSPRYRHPSLTQAAIQDLVNHPPSTSRHQNPKFVGREWGDITIGELVSLDDVRWTDIECSVEEATLVSTDCYLRCCLIVSYSRRNHRCCYRVQLALFSSRMKLQLPTQRSVSTIMT